MARSRIKSRSSKSQSGDMVNPTVLVVLIIGVVAGFLGGFIFARDRYNDKIASISEMNMEKAVTIDSLSKQLQVLGASTQAANK